MTDGKFEVALPEVTPPSMIDLVQPTSSEGSKDIPNLESGKLIDILQGNLGFHYTVERALPTSFREGLLSLDEEKRRGLSVRTGRSRSYSDSIYFTTRFNDLYFHRDYDKSLQEDLGQVVGIVIDRPDYVNKHGHFGKDHAVDVERFKALVFIDRVTLPKKVVLKMMPMIHMTFIIHYQ